MPQPSPSTRCDFVAARLRLTAALEIRVALQTLNDSCLLHIREYFLGEENEYRPTQKGVAVPIVRLNEVLEAIRELRAAGPNEGLHAVVAMSRGHEIRFAVTGWKGALKADIRLHFPSPDGVNKLPSKKGLRLSLGLLSELERAIEVVDRHVGSN